MEGIEDITIPIFIGRHYSNILIEEKIVGSNDSELEFLKVFKLLDDNKIKFTTVEYHTGMGVLISFSDGIRIEDDLRKAMGSKLTMKELLMFYNNTGISVINKVLFLGRKLNQLKGGYYVEDGKIYDHRGNLAYDPKDEHIKSSMTLNMDVLVLAITRELISPMNLHNSRVWGQTYNLKFLKQKGDTY